MTILELRLRLLDVIDKCEWVHHPTDLAAIKADLERIADDLPSTDMPSVSRPKWWPLWS